MKNYSTKSTNKLLISFVAKSVITTILSLLIFTFLASELMYRLDIDLEKISIMSIVIVSICSLIIGFISVYKIKNSGMLFGVIAQIPLVFYMLINAVFHSGNWLYFVIKLCIVVLSGALAGLYVTEKSKKIRV